MSKPEGSWCIGAITLEALKRTAPAPPRLGRRSWLRTVAVTMLTSTSSVIMAACGSPLGRGRTQAPPASALPPATLTFLSRGGPDQRALDDQVTAAFMADYPTVKVEVVTAKDYENELIAQAAGGSTPDVGFGLISTNVIHYLKKINRSLTPFIAKDKSFKRTDYDPYWLDVFDWHGQLVAVPLDPAMVVTYYNKTLFDNASRRYPDPTTAMTWEDTIALAKELTLDSSGRSAAGAGLDQGNVVQVGLDWTLFGHEWYPMVRQYGQEPFDPQFTKLNEDGAIQALQFLGDLYHKHRVSLAPNQQPKQPIGFDKGNVAIKVFGTWDVKTWRKTPGDVWDIAPMPHLQGKPRAGIGWGSGLELLAGKAPADVAWELFKYLIGRKGQEIYVRGGLGQPMLKAMFNDPVFTQSAPPHHPEVLINETKVAKPPIHSHPAYNDMKAIMGQALTAVYNGEKTASQAVHEVAPNINSTLSDWAKRIEEMSRG